MNIARNMQINITVAIITRNRAQHLKRLLNSFIIQTRKPLEIIIINNSSNDNTKEIIKSFQSSLPIRSFTEKKVGIPFSRNNALKQARGNFVAFIDDDCEASPTWIENINNALKKYPDVAAIQGRTISMPSNNIIPRIVQSLHDSWLKKSIRQNKLWVCDTKNLVLNLRIIKKYQLTFDTDFLRGSDVDLAKQFIYKNLQIIYQPKIYNFHFERDTLRSLLQQVTLQGMSRYNHLYKWSEQYFPEIYINPDSYYKKVRQNISTSQIEGIFVKIILLLQKRYFLKGFEIQKKHKLLTNKFVPRNKLNNLSIAIVTRNRSVLLKECLKSLILQTHYPKEILIIDNGSTDDTKKVASEFSNILPIRYFSEIKVGIASARNRALIEAKGEILGFIDDDCEAASDWTRNIIKAHKKHLNAVAIQGKCSLLNKNLIGKISHRIVSSWIRGHLIGKKRIATLDTMNASFKIKTLRKYKIKFDTQLNKYFRGEDTDLAYQLTSFNLPMIYSTECLVYYHSRPDILSYFKQQFYTGAVRAFLVYKWSYLFTKKINIAEIKIDNIYHPTYQITFRLISYLRRKIYVFGMYYEMIELLNKRTNLKIPSGLLRHYNKQDIYSVSLIIFIRKNDPNTMSRILNSVAKQSVLPDEVIYLFDKNTNPPLTNNLVNQKEINTTKIFLNGVQPYTFIFDNHIKFKGDIIAVIDENCDIKSDWLKNIKDQHKIFRSVGVIRGRIMLKINSFKDLYSQNILDAPFFDQNQFRVGIFQSINVSIKKRYLEYINLQNKYVSKLDSPRFKNEIVLLEMELSNPRTTIYRHEITLNYDYSYMHFLDFMKSLFDEKVSLSKINHLKKELILPNYKLSTFIWVNLQFDFLFLLSIWNINRISWKILMLILKLFDYILLAIAYFMAKIQIEDSLVIFKKYHINRVPVANFFNIVIPVRDRPKELVELLKSILVQNVLPNRVIIIDNGSSVSETQNILRIYNKNLPITYYKEKNIGIPFVRNKALELVNSGILAFIDDDCVLTANWIRNTIVTHQRHRDATAVQGRSSSFGNNHQINYIAQYRHNSLMNQLVLDLNNQAYYIYEAQKRPLYMKSLDTKNVSLKVNNIKKIDLKFDNNLIRGEDIDFGRNLVLQKESILFDPSIGVFHKERNNLISFLKQSFLRGKYLVKLEQKWERTNKIRFASINLETYINFISSLFSTGKDTKNIGSYICIYYLFNLFNDLGILIGLVNSKKKNLEIAVRFFLHKNLDKLG